MRSGYTRKTKTVHNSNLPCRSVVIAVVNNMCDHMNLNENKQMNRIWQPRPDARVLNGAFMGSGCIYSVASQDSGHKQTIAYKIRKP